MEKDPLDELFSGEDTDYDKLCHLVEEMTTTGQKELDAKYLKMLKSVTKKSEQNIKHTFRLLMTQLGKYHAEIRYSTFQLIDQIFQRSHQFRNLLAEDFHRFLELTVDINKEIEFPPPYATAKELKLMALRCIAQWDQKFGDAYQKLRLGCSYLKRVKKIEFADIRTRTEVERKQVEMEERRQEVVMKRKVEYVRRCLRESGNDIEACITQAESCLQLLIPNVNEIPSSVDRDSGGKEVANYITESQDLADNESENGDHFKALASINQGPDCGTSVGIRNMSYAIEIDLSSSNFTIQEDVNNTDILRTLSDLHNEIVKHHFPSVKQWTNILTKARNESDLLQRVMDLKVKLQQVNDKYCELNIISSKQKEPKLLIQRDLAMSDEDESETEEFEDVPEIHHDVELTDDSLVTGTAPVVASSSSRDSVDTNGREDGMWRQPSTLNTESKTASGKKRTSWTCRASLPSGLLCERQDLIKCPFHGTIIPRNVLGMPSNQIDYDKEAKRRKEDELRNLAEVQKDIQLAKGIALSSDPAGRQKLKAARYSRLTNLKESRNTARNRLGSKVLSKKALIKVADSLDGLDKRRNLENYGCNFNYR